MSNEIKKQDNLLSTQSDVPMGFEDEEEGDLIVPRVKIIQSLSPERKEKIADEGDIINSLTKEKLTGKVFIPVFKFNNNIWWKPRSEGGGIQCIAREGKVGIASDGQSLLCKMCRKNEFDNSKQGAEALPSCTKYINFFGFFEGERMPIILSFAKTNYNEGKKLYSLAKVTMQNMWNFGYVLNNKEMSKGGNDWFNIVVAANGITSDEDREFALQLFHSFRNRSDLNFDMEDTSSSDYEASGPSQATKEDVENAEF
jgi:hypothetical protein